MENNIPYKKLTIEDAIKQSSFYDIDEYYANKEKFDRRFFSIANTEESQQTLLDYIANDKTEIDIDDIARKNASAHKGDRVSHGLFAYGDNAWKVNDNTAMSQTDIIERNLNTVISDKNIELALTEDVYKLGPIGVTGTADVTGYFPKDIASMSKDGMRHSNLKGSAVIDDILEDGLGQSYSEYYGKNFNIESLWVKNSFFNENEDYVISLLQKHNIENVDLIHDNHSFSPEYTKKSLNFDRVKTEDLIARRQERQLKTQEETTITIEDNNKGVKTKTTTSASDTTPDSVQNQNNAEKIKQQEPINNPDKPKPQEPINNPGKPKPSKPEFTTTNSEYNKYVWEEYKKGNTDVMSADEYYRSKHTPEQQTKIDEINNRTQQPNSKPESTQKPDVSETNTKPGVPEKPKPEPEVKPVNNSEVESKPVKTPKPDIPKKKPNYKPQRGPRVNSSTVNATKEQIEKVVKNTGMKTKKLAGDAAKAIGEGVNWGKVGKVGAVVGVAALIGGGVYSHVKKENKNKANGPDRLTGATRKSEFWNQSYTAQMAKDISTYQYGKRMTGFVQG